MTKRPRKLGDVLAEKEKQSAKPATQSIPVKPSRVPRRAAASGGEAGTPPVAEKPRSGAARRPAGAKSVGPRVARSGQGASEAGDEAATAPATKQLRTKLSADERQAAIDEAFELPYDPPSYHFEPSDDPLREMASRELCRRKLLPFIQRFRPKYTAGWVHEDICRRIERFVKQVEAGQSPRLLLMCPPRMGKSEIGSRHTPAWILGQHPDWEIIAASHTSSLSLSFSRYLRDLIRDSAYTAVFPEMKLDPSSQSVENWNTTKGGGYLAAGVGTGITGRGCLAPYSHVDTNRGKIRIVDLKVGDSVYGYDHRCEKVVETVVQAVQVTERSKPLVDFGNVRLTTDHRIYDALQGDYVSAGERPQLSGLRRQEGASCCDVQGVLFSPACGSSHHAEMRLLWEELFAQRSGVSEVEGPSRACGEGVLQPTLLQRIQTGQPCSLQQGEGAVHSLWKACDWHGSHEVLQHDLLQRASSVEASNGELRIGIPDAEEEDIGSRQEMPAVRNNACSLRGASCERGRDEQHTFEHGPALRGVPPQVSSVHGTCAADLAAVFEEFDFVVDIQTGTSNFFTEGLLVHNCHVLVVDDVVKDIEAADSLTIRDNTWEWYLSTAYTRLAPGGGVIGILTWWHDDDWAGRIQQAMAADDGADQFEIIRYPAINELGDEYILPDDSIAQFQPDTPVPAGSRLTRRHNTAVHPARYTTEMMLKIKHNLIGGGQKRVWDALYQQNPIPDEGNFFSKEMFRYYGMAPARNELYIYQAWDFAISEGKESDYTVGVCMGQDHRDNLYVLDVKRFRSQDGGYIVDEILDFAREYDADLLGFEDGQIWKAIEFQFTKRCSERRHYPSFEVLKPLTDKMVRANPLKGRMQIGKIYFDKAAVWFTELYKEMLHFPAGKHDDQVDGMSWAVRLTLTRSAPREQRHEPKVKSWKDGLGRFLPGGRGGHMSA